jgi:HAD superfamily hydrolase (TIGR01509 family)
MIRAIIFDCFGVLTTDAWLPFKNKYFAQNEVLMARASELNKQSDAGFISYQSFLDEIGAMSGMTGQEVKSAISNNVPNIELFEYLRQLKADYKIGLLSNASDDWLGELFTTEQAALFDAQALSYETHFSKPSSEAYKTIADRLNVAVGDCIFIDDQERFVSGACDAGMFGIFYKDNAQLKAELTILLTDTKD